MRVRQWIAGRRCHTIHYARDSLKGQSHVRKPALIEGLTTATHPREVQSAPMARLRGEWEWYRCTQRSRRVIPEVERISMPGTQSECEETGEDPMRDNGRAPIAVCSGHHPSRRLA